MPEACRELFEFFFVHLKRRNGFRYGPLVFLRQSFIFLLYFLLSMPASCDLVLSTWNVLAKVCPMSPLGVLNSALNALTSCVCSEILEDRCFSDVRCFISKVYEGGVFPKP